MKDKLENLFIKIKENKSKEFRIILGVFVLFIFIFIVYSLSNSTYINRLFANIDKLTTDTFKDDNFYNCVVDAYNNANPDNKKDELSADDLAGITSLSCPYKNITNTSGLEKMTSLTYLDLFGNSISSIDLSQNTALTSIRLDNNLLYSIPTMEIGDTYTIENNIVLPENKNVTYTIENPTIAKIEGGVITALENGITNLIVDTGFSDGVISTNIIVGDPTFVFEDSSFNACVVDTYNNKKGTSKTYDEGLSINELASIEELSCSSNYSIKSTDGIENLTNLTSISIDSSNSLENIDLSNNKEIKKINLFLLMSLKKLDVSGLEKLEEIDCYSCQFNNIDLSTNKKLKILNLRGSVLNDIDLSNNKLLEELNLSYGTVGLTNNISEIDLSNNVNLKHLNLDGNGLSSLDLSNNINLKSLFIGNSQDTEHPNTLIPDFNIKDLMFVGDKFKLDTSNINIVPPKGWEFNYSLDNESLFDVNDNEITARESGYSNLSVKMGDIEIYTKNIKVTDLRLSSSSYEINNDEKYINIKDHGELNVNGDTVTVGESILNDIYVESDTYFEKRIQDNKLQLIYNGDYDNPVKEYSIIGYRINNEMLQKSYDYSTGGYKIFMGAKEFDLEKDLLIPTGCKAEEIEEKDENNLIDYSIVISDKNNNKIKPIRLLKVSSDYDLDNAYSQDNNGYYIYTKTGNIDINKFTLSKGLKINSNDWGTQYFADDEGNTYANIYPVYIQENSNYKIIDDSVYFGLIDTDSTSNFNIIVTNGRFKKDGNKFNIYAGYDEKENEVAVASYNIIGLEFNFNYYNDEDSEEYYGFSPEYSFESNSLYLGVHPFDAQIITKDTSKDENISYSKDISYNITTSDNILEIKYKKNIIDKIKIINVYLPEKLKVIYDKTNVMDSNELVICSYGNFDRKLINNITNMDQIDKNKINIINGEIKYIIEEEDGEQLVIYPLSDNESYRNENIERIPILNIYSDNYDLTKDYIYLGTKEFENDINLEIYGEKYTTKDLEDSKSFLLNDESIKIRREEKCSDDKKCTSPLLILEITSWDFVKVSSSKYNMDSDVIKLKNDEEFDLSNIKVVNGVAELKDGELLIKYKDSVAKRIKIEGGKSKTTTTTTTKKQGIINKIFRKTATVKKGSTITVKKSTITTKKQITTRKNTTTNVVSKTNNLTNKKTNKMIIYQDNILLTLSLLLMISLVICLAVMYRKRKNN